MKDKAWKIAGVKPENVFVVIASYEEGADENASIANANAALDEKILFDNPDFNACNGGLAETIETGGITDVAAVDTTIEITMAGAWESADNDDVIIPVVLYKGKSVAHEMISDILSASTNKIVLDNSSGLFSAEGADYEVYLIGAIHASVKSASPPETSLPTSKTDTKTLGSDVPVESIQTNDGLEVTGGVTFLLDNKLIKHQGGGTGRKMNTPGEDIDRAIAGNDWNVNGWNELGYLTKPFAISYIYFSGQKNVTDNDGQVFAQEKRVYGCKMNSRAGDQGVEGGGRNMSREISYTTTIPVKKRTLVFDSGNLNG